MENSGASYVKNDWSDCIISEIHSRVFFTSKMEKHRVNGGCIP